MYVWFFDRMCYIVGYVIQDEIDIVILYCLEVKKYCVFFSLGRIGDVDGVFVFVLDFLR